MYECFHRFCLSLLRDTCLTFLQRVKVVKKAKVIKHLAPYEIVFCLFCQYSYFSVTITSVSAVKGEAKVLIKTFFSRVQRCESEADWAHLKRSHNSKAPESKD